jgi:hypothetical protein
MDKETFQGFLEVRADIEANRAVLLQLIGEIVVNTAAEPQKLLARMHQNVKDRLDKAPPDPTPEGAAVTALIRTRVDQFFAKLGQAVVAMAGGPGSQTPH